MDIEPEISNKNRTGVIDVIAHDPGNRRGVPCNNEPNEWDGSDEQLFSLQERFNAYVSFLLDGEMAEAHPELAGKPIRIELRCAHMPDTRALELLGQHPRDSTGVPGNQAGSGGCREAPVNQLQG
jgi:hypothetical protein